MSDDTTETKSKEYIRPMPANWWMMKKAYVLFIVRELTCVFVGGYALFLLVLASRVGEGPERWTASSKRFLILSR